MKNSSNNFKVIVGLGKTGMSCVRYLARQECSFSVVDSRINPPGLEELQQNFSKILVHTGGFDAAILSQADELIISPGVALSEPALTGCIKRGIKAIGDIELFAKATTTPIIAITGSNGKSTVTSLVGAMIAAAGKKAMVGGNLGEPALDLLEQDNNCDPKSPQKKADFYVLELSSFQLETTFSLRAEVAVVLNISPDHMDRYRNFAEYLQAKQRIYVGCRTAIINRDDPASYAGVTLPPRVVSFGLDHPQKGNFGFANGFLMLGDQKLLTARELKIKGLHNTANVLAALAVGSAIDLPLDAMLVALRNFGGLPHRCQWVAKINNVDWYNDSKGTNVGATKSAIEGLGSDIAGKIILIAGGVGKGADFSLLRNVVTKYVRAIILIGKDAALIQQALAGAAKILLASSMLEAVKLSAHEALAADAVLLSPACASMDMFDNFEHRGEVFIDAIKNCNSNV